jgi:nucleotide-binding universal stress UspA family protein
LVVDAEEAGTMYDAILVPTDGSRLADRAATHALDLAAAFDATVHAISVVPPGRDDADADAAVDAVADRASDRSIPVETAVLDGVPYRAILDYVQDEGVDLVVMGTHGRTGLDRYLLGSVTERVVRAAPVPVLTVGPDDDTAVTDPDRAVAIARDALAAEGHDDATVRGDPYRQSGTWVVQARADDRAFNVHVDAASGSTRVARVQGFEDGE